MTALICVLAAVATLQPADAAPQPHSAPTPALPIALASVADDEAMNRWTGNVGIGINFTDGNSNTLTGSASADAEYRREQDRFSLKFLWNYQEDSDTSPSLTERQTYLMGQYDYFLSDQTYAFGRLQGQADFAAALDLRTTVAAGLGRQFREDETWKLRGEAGLAWIDEDYKGTASDNDYPAAALSYSANWVPNEKWELAQDTFWYPSLDDIHDMVSRVDSRAKYLLSTSMYGQVQWIWDWTRTPATGSEPTDHTILLTFGWAF